MENLFADRISDVPKSFIREILKTTIDPSCISFAGGLPNRNYFPVQEIKESCIRVLDEAGEEALQYSTTDGYLPLREYICERYKKKGIIVSPEDILITNGSQQGLDLISKILLNEGDKVMIERPGYLGAIQSFSLYRADFLQINLENNGPVISDIEKSIKEKSKLFYSVPNFQNPSGTTWSSEKRKEIGNLIEGSETILIEDDPYGELRFSGSHEKSMRHYSANNTVLLGSFSKVFAPSFRLGWICAKQNLMERIIVAKQAADLHTNYFSQRVLYDYLTHNDLDNHIVKIKEAYGTQAQAMISSLEKHLSKEITFTRPEGGMFLWVTLPRDIDSMELFEKAMKMNVAFVPGIPFYAKNPESNTLRLNFSCSDEKTIEEGIKRLAQALKA